MQQCIKNLILAIHNAVNVQRNKTIYFVKQKHKKQKRIVKAYLSTTYNKLYKNNLNTIQQHYSKLTSFNNTCIALNLKALNKQNYAFALRVHTQIQQLFIVNSTKQSVLNAQRYYYSIYNTKTLNLVQRNIYKVLAYIF